MRVLLALAALLILFGVVKVIGAIGGKLAGSKETEAQTEAVTEVETEIETQAVTKTISPFTMAFAGDVMFSEDALDSYEDRQLNGLFSPGVQEVFSNADFLMLNEEFPFGTGGTAADKQYVYEVDPSYVSIFQDMGVDVVSLANNHVLDYGADVLKQTFSSLTTAGIKYTGAGNTVDEASSWQSFSLGGANVAVLSASRVLPSATWSVESSQPGVFSAYDTTILVRQIKAAKQQNDLVVVYLHWGTEKTTTPEDYQREMAYELIDAGADLIIGSHPHVLQGIEYYNGVPIVYSLGNLVFDESMSQGAILTVDVDSSMNLTLKIVPIGASNYRTYVKDDDAAQEGLTFMESLSTGITISEDGTVMIGSGSSNSSTSAQITETAGESAASAAADTTAAQEADSSEEGAADAEDAEVEEAEPAAEEAEPEADSSEEGAAG